MSAIDIGYVKRNGKLDVEVLHPYSRLFYEIFYYEYFCIIELFDCSDVFSLLYISDIMKHSEVV